MDFLKLVFLVLASSALSTAAPQGQQCLSCTIDKAIGTDECKDTPRIRYCSEKCSYFVMLGRGDEPNYDKPYIVRGCSTDGYMRKFGCSSRCYNRKHTVGSDEYWVCTFCCTGDKCNKAALPGIDAGLQLNGGLFTTFQAFLGQTSPTSFVARGKGTSPLFRVQQRK